VRFLRIAEQYDASLFSDGSTKKGGSPVKIIGAYYANTSSKNARLVMVTHVSEMETKKSIKRYFLMARRRKTVATVVIVKTIK